MTTLDTEHTFTITVGGNNVTAHLLHDTIKIVDALAHEIDTCNFALEDHDGTMPTVDIWMEVIITDEGADRVFAGHATRRKVEPAPSDARRRVTLYCQDYTALLKTVVVMEDYTDQTDEAVLDDLFTNYLPEITTANVTASVGTYSFVFDNVTLFDAVKQVAEKARARWKVDYSKDLHYWTGTTPAAADFGISDAPDFLATYPFDRGTLSYTDDGEAIVNRVIVQGGVGPSAVITEYFSGDGVEVEFFLSTRPIRSLVSITVGGIYQTYDTDFVIDDFVDKDGYMVDCLVNYHRGRVRWDGATPPAVGTNNIAISYVSDTEVAVTCNHVGSQTKYGRIFTRRVTDRDISTVEEAEAYGEAYLAEHAVRHRVGRVEVERYGLSSGEAFDVTCAAIGLDGNRGYGEDGYGDDGYGGDDYVLQTVTTSFSNRGVKHGLEFAEFQPSLGTMIANSVRGTVSTGGTPAGGAGSGVAGVVGSPAPTGIPPLQEGEVYYGGRYEAVDERGAFQWDAYGTVTGIVFGLDTSKSPVEGKILGLLDGVVQVSWEADGKIYSGDKSVYLGYNGWTMAGGSVGGWAIGPTTLTGTTTVLNSANGRIYFDTAYFDASATAGMVDLFGAGLRIPTGDIDIITGHMRAAGITTGNLENKAIIGGVIVVSESYVSVISEGEPAADDLDTISIAEGDAETGWLLVLQLGGSGAVTLKDGTGNLNLLTDFTLSTDDDRIFLIYDGVDAWQEISRSDQSGDFNIGGDFLIGGVVVLDADGAPLYNIWVGDCPHDSVTTAHYNVVMGRYAGFSLVEGYENVFIGYWTGYNEIDGNSNVFIGSGAGESSINSSSSTFIGSGAGNRSQVAELCTFIGQSAGNNCGKDFDSYGLVTENTCVGYYAGAGSAGDCYYDYCTFVGSSAGAYHNLGDFQVVVGCDAATWQDQGEKSVVIGAKACFGRSGDDCIHNNGVIIGYGAGYLMESGAHNNILIGYQVADNLTTGHDNIIIAYNLNASAVDVSNELNLGGVLYGTLGANCNLTVNATTVSVNYDLMLAGDGVLGLKETTTPTADADYGKIYCKNDNKAYFQDGAGVEHELGLSGGHAILDGTIHTDSVADDVSRGSIIYGNATPKWDELVLGTIGQHLESDGTDIAWVTNLTMVDGATIGQAAGPLVTFDDTLKYLEITGCYVGFGTTTPGRLIHAEVADAVTNTVTYAQRLGHITSDTVVAGFGTGIEFELEENDASNRIAAIIETLWTDAGDGANADADLVLKLMLNDAAAAEKGRLTSAGDFKVSGDYYSGGNQGLTGTLTVDDGANWRFTLTFVGGILTGQTTAGTTAAAATWA